MSLAPLNLVDAHPWTRVAFTTYAVSLSFFESVILDRLVRGGGSQALILADVQGVRASLSEQGAQRVGKDYELEPVVVAQGVFHPKLTVLSAADECHLLIGSGNLTFGGWGGHCEVLEHLHPGFAAGAISDAAEFFERLPETPRVRHRAGGQCAAIAADLRRAIQGRPVTGDIRLIHNLDTSIEEQLVGFAAEMDGATRLAAMSPFWDGGAAIDSLCAALGLSELFIHAHEHGCVEGKAANWPRHSASRVQAVSMDLFEASDQRRLHAKAFEVLCRRGRIIVSGSANGTTAALGRGHNVEACIVRLQRERMTGWRFSASHVPEPEPAAEEDTDNGDEPAGVLRAVLEADQLVGDVLTPRMSGAVSVCQVTPTGAELLAETTLGPEGAFRIAALSLEEASWFGGRLVIRVVAADGSRSEGFVSVASYADISRRAGLLGRRLFALLAGTETPADVAAIMSWFHEDPERLAAAAHITGIGASGEGRKEQPDQLIPVTALNQHYVEGAAAAAMTRSGGPQQSWSRFVDHILRAFRTARGPFSQSAAGGVGDDDDDDDDQQGGGASETGLFDPAIEKSLAVFERLFKLLTKAGGSPRNALIAFDLTQYVCARLRPDAAQAKAWLESLIKALLDGGVPPERKGDVAAAALALMAMAPEQSALRWARGCLLRLQVDFSGDPPLADGVQGYISVLPPQSSFSELWPRLRAIRTYHEQVRSYQRALDEGRPAADDYPDLAHEACEEWPAMEAALGSETARRRLAIAASAPEACPRCHITLPRGEAFKMRSVGIATAKGCCGRVVIWAGR